MPTLVLPNINMKEPIDYSMAALASCEDPRVLGLRLKHPPLDAFLSQFTDAFQVPVRPSIILVRSDAPSNFMDMGAIASFRDVISMSVLPYQRALQFQYPNNPRILYSNSFALYPWYLGADNETLVLNTDAVLGAHRPDKFHGQSSPELSSHRLDKSDLDIPILEALLVRWRIRYGGRRVAWADRALFRSLNMANQASQIPATADATLHDRGRSIALWISACEILVHPGRKMKSSRNLVLELLEKVNWETRFCGRRVYSVKEHRKPSTRRVFACWLYDRMYWLRNQFLHGNPVTVAQLKLKGTNAAPIWFYGPILYRLALTAFLDLSLKLEKRSMDNWEISGRQGAIEQGLRTARGIKE